MATDLVIQGFDVETADLKRLAKLSGATEIQRVSDEAFRLVDGHAGDGTIPQVCAERELDCAFVPRSRKLADFRLLVMDMDSTLITIETIDELADLVGLKKEVADITAQAMRGEIEYNESLRRRVAVLKDLEEHALQRVYEERVKLTPGAEKLLSVAQGTGLKTLLVSGGFTHVTELLKERLKLDYARANTLEVVEGKLTGTVIGDIVNADGKREALLNVSHEIGAKREQLIGIGDGANDLKFLAECGVSVAYHAKPVVRGQTTHAINYVNLDGVLNLFQ